MGNVITEDNLNDIMPVIANTFLDKILEKEGLDKKNIRELNPIVVSNENIDVGVDGDFDIADLAETYKDFYTAKLDDGTVVIPFVDLNAAEFDDWDASSIIDADNQPFLTVRNTYFDIRPKDIGADMYISYIREPNSPFRAYAIDYATAESVYLTTAGYIVITAAGAAGDTVTVKADAVTLGAYTVLSGDSASDIMKALSASINSGLAVHGCKAVYDNEKLWININTGSYTTLSTVLTGTVTRSLTNFASRSTQFDWENDLGSMLKMVEIFVGMAGLSTKENLMVQWSEMQQAKK